MATVIAIAAGKSLLDDWKYDPTFCEAIVADGEMAELLESVGVGLPVESRELAAVGSDVGRDEGKRGFVEAVGRDELDKGLTRFGRFAMAVG